MKNQKLIPLIKGAIKHLPLVKKGLHKRHGGTIDSRYCYSVWMRHLKNLDAPYLKFPKTVAELGPGNSMGIGFAALLSGCVKIYALDVCKYWDNERNVKIFDELVELFKQKASIPDNKEFPNIKPEIDDYSFPNDLIPEAQLETSLSPERLQAIRNEIMDIDNPRNTHVKIHIPWYDSHVLEKHSVDFIYSQAVLEHVEDLEKTYHAMCSWLKPLGMMSHTIDFKSHNVTKKWNGHWTFNDFEWKIVKGGKDFLINRQPFSYHVDLHNKYGFKVMKKSFAKMKNDLSKKQLSKKFESLTDDELTTSGMYILSRKEL